MLLAVKHCLTSFFYSKDQGTFFPDASLSIPHCQVDPRKLVSVYREETYNGGGYICIIVSIFSAKNLCSPLFM